MYTLIRVATALELYTMSTEFIRLPSLAAITAKAVELAKAGYTLYDVSIYAENHFTSYRPGLILIADGKPDVSVRWYAMDPDGDTITVDHFGKRARVEARDAGLAMMALVQDAIDAALNPNEIDATEYKIARRLVEKATDEGYTVTVDDGGAIALERSSDVNAIMAALGTSGIDHVTFYTPMGRRTGTVMLIWGNGTDLISDYAAPDLDAMEAWLKPVSDYADALAGY